MDKRRSIRSEKRRDRISTRNIQSSPVSTQIKSPCVGRNERIDGDDSVPTASLRLQPVPIPPRRHESLGGYSIYDSKVGELERMENQMMTTSQTQSDHNHDEDSSIDEEELPNFPGAYRISSIEAPRRRNNVNNRGIDTVNEDEEEYSVFTTNTANDEVAMSSTAIKALGVVEKDAGQIVVPSASLVEEKDVTTVSAVEAAKIPILYAQEGDGGTVLLTKRMVRCIILGSCLVFIALAGALFLSLLDRNGTETATSSSLGEETDTDNPTSVPVSPSPTTAATTFVPSSLGEGMDDKHTLEPSPTTTTAPTDTMVITHFPTLTLTSNTPTSSPTTKNPTNAPTNPPSDSPIEVPRTASPSAQPTINPTAASTTPPPTIVQIPTPRPTSIAEINTPAPTCLARGDSCTFDFECCNNLCRGQNGFKVCRGGRRRI